MGLLDAIIIKMVFMLVKKWIIANGALNNTKKPQAQSIDGACIEML